MKRVAVMLMALMVLGFCLVGCVETSTDSLPRYKIIYSEDMAHDELTCLQNSGYDDNCEFNLYCAERLQAAIKSELGIELPICLDTDVAESEFEILIGQTNRKQTSELKLKSLKEQDYIIAENSGKLVVCGGSFGETWQAVGVLTQGLQGDGAAITKNGITQGCNKRGSVALTTIACIGDSLTWGSQSISPEYLSYPAILQRLLWKSCIVKKYANPGKTMHSEVDYTALTCGFTQTAEWSKCLADAETFDIALIMLGTNDSYCINLQPAVNRPWLTNYQQGFADSFLQMLADITEINGDVKFTLMNCPRVYANGYNTSEICIYQEYSVDKAIEQGYDVDLCDMDSATYALNQAIYFDADGLHFNTKGYLYVANLVKNMLAKKLDLEV